LKPRALPLGISITAIHPLFVQVLSRADGAGISAKGSPVRIEARGEIIMALPRGISITDISVIHPLSVQVLSHAADTVDPAASFCDQQ
jgi:hypothetical protein